MVLSNGLNFAPFTDGYSYSQRDQNLLQFEAADWRLSRHQCTDGSCLFQDGDYAKMTFI